MKRRNLIILWLIAPAMLIGVILSTQLQPTIVCAFQGRDLIDEYACITEIKLSRYDEQPQELVEWLLSYHGEATGAQVLYSLADWAVTEPEKFSDLLSQVDETRSDEFIDDVAWGLRETGFSARFKAAFASQVSKNERLRRIIEQLWK